MTGKLCLRADQTALVNAALSASTDEVVWADTVIARLGEDRAHVRQRSDRPMLKRARTSTSAGAIASLLNSCAGVSDEPHRQSDQASGGDTLLVPPPLPVRGWRSYSLIPTTGQGASTRMSR